jgi:hypothetical protein
MTAAVRAPAWVADPDQHPGRPVPVVTVVLARAFPKEPISRLQLIGLAAAVVAVILLAI